MNKKTQTTKTAIDRDKLDELSGDAETRPAPKFVLPSVKLNANKTSGNFFRTVIKNEKLVLDDSGKALLEDMGESIKGVILKVRRTYFEDSADMQTFTNEVGYGKNEKVSVFCKTENTKGGFNTTFVFSGTTAQVKERYPELKMIQIVYFLLEDTNEIVRLKVKGMSLPALFDYFKSFESYERKFEYITEIGRKSMKMTKNGKALEFFVCTFKKGKRVEDLSNVETAIEEVYNKITEIEEYYKDYNQAVEQEEIPFERKEDEKVLTNENADEEKEEYDVSRLEGDEEIDPKKIPF